MTRQPPREFYANPDWDVDGWVDIIGVEYRRLVDAYPFDEVFRSLGGSVDLLDVGCGTAIFPTFLDPVLSEDVRVRADLLDQSESSLRRAAEVLTALDHFTVGESFLANVEAHPDLGKRRYDIIWAIHSFTTVDRDKMPDVFQALMEALRPNGWLYVYQLTAASAYQQVHGRYLAGRGGYRYMEYEDSAAMLSAAGYDFEVYELAFDHVVPDRAESLAGYLQKVTLDDSVTADSFEPVLSRYRADGAVRFPQTVNLIAVPEQGRR